MSLIKSIILVLLISTFMFAQEYEVSLKVTVTRSDNGRRIPGAQVRFFGVINGTAATNDNGVILARGRTSMDWDQQDITDVFAHGYLKPITRVTETGTGVLGLRFSRNRRNLSVNISLDPVAKANAPVLSRVTLIKPKNNQVAPNNFTFKWETIPSVRVYEIQVGYDSNFQSTLYKDFVENVADFREQEKKYSGFYNGSTYYWRVRAGNGFNWGEWSNIESFRYSSTYRPRDW